MLYLKNMAIAIYIVVGENQQLSMYHKWQKLGGTKVQSVSKEINLPEDWWISSAVMSMQFS